MKVKGVEWRGVFNVFWDEENHDFVILQNVIKDHIKSKISIQIINKTTN